MHKIKTKTVANHPRSRLLGVTGFIALFNGFLVLLTLNTPQTLLAWFNNAATTHVIHISVDGLGASYIQSLMNDPSNPVPNFKKLRDEGAWTMNARTDFDYSITLPNHTAMLTGRSVEDKNGVLNSGHHWVTNITPPPGTILQGNAGYSIASVFDVAHSNGLRTGLYASKEKFVLFKDSYAANIDAYANYDLDSTSMMNDLLTNMNANPSRYTFVHFNDTDSAGHAFGWGSAEYIAAAKKVDGHLGQLFNLIANNAQMAGKTKIILSADHGGTGLGHSDQTLTINHTIPMFIWGEGIAANSNLYTLNGNATQDPGNGRPDQATNIAQPIRNGDGGNCALRMLGLPTISGSTIANLYAPCGVAAPAQPNNPSLVTLVPAGANWRFFDGGTNLGVAWRAANADLSTWDLGGPAPLGYGDPVSTTVDGGPDGNRFITTYFRRNFTLNPNNILSLTLQLRRDDGAVVYLNNIEVVRSNMPNGAINFNTLATASIGGADETAWLTFSVPITALVTGENIVAVELHQQSATSSDIVFDLALLGSSASPATATATATRTPAQTATPTSTATKTPSAQSTNTPTPTPTVTNTPVPVNPGDKKFVFLPMAFCGATAAGQCIAR